MNRIISVAVLALGIGGCTHIGGVSSTSDGSGVWVGKNTTVLGVISTNSLYFCEKSKDKKVGHCTEFTDESEENLGRGRGGRGGPSD